MGRIAGPGLGYQTGTLDGNGQLQVTGTFLQYRFDISDAGVLTVMDGNFTPLMTATGMEQLRIRQADGTIIGDVPIITGTGGDDTLDRSDASGREIVAGTAGNDTVTLNASGGVAMGGGGNDTLKGGDVGDGLYGGSGTDRLEGGGGDDWLVGDEGNDTLVGGDGSDSAGFYIRPGSAQTATVTISAYDSALGGFKVLHGSDVRASLVWNASAQTWTVTDLSGDAATGFGADTVSGVEFLTFDPFIAGVSALRVDLGALTGVDADDFCTLDPATEYAGYVAAAGSDLVTSLPTGLTRHVSLPVEKNGFISAVTSYGTDYANTIDAFIAEAGSGYGFLLQDFEGLAPGNFAGSSSSYVPATGSYRLDSTGDLSAGMGSGTLLVDGLMAIKLFNTTGSVGAGGDSAGDDAGIATNAGNDADRGYNQTEGGNLYLEVLPGNTSSGGVLFCFDPLSTPVYGFGFHLMGREAGKRDVYLDVHLSDGTIYRELTGTNANDTGGQQFYSFTIDPGVASIEGFVLYEPWVAETGGDRDIFAIDDLALVVANKTDSLTGAQYREEILGRNGESGGGGGGGGGGEGNPQGTATVVFQQSVSIDDLIDATIFDDTSTAQITSTMLTVVSGDGLASVRLIGSDLTWTPLADGDFALTGGTITRAEFDAGATAGALSPAVVLSGLAINAVVLDAAVDEAWDTNLQDTSAFDALLDAYQYDITGTAASERLEGSQWDDTLRGGGGGDTLVGWEGDDVLIVGSNAAGFEYGLVSPGTGNDTIDYAAVVTGDHLLSYEFQPAGVDLSIDGVNKVGSVLKGSSGQWEDTLLGVDKLLNVANHPTVAGSAQILGSAHADTFEINLAGNQWISIRGLAGSDTFEFAGNGWTRLDYILSPDGVDVNLAQGKAYDDGYGTQDTIIGNVNELRGSNSSDKLIGSDGDESFIPRGGNDTIDGGGGFDRVRYDQGNVTALEVDLLDGRATGFQDGVAFVHQLSGIEHVRGSNQADFLLSGTGSVRLEGRGGADEFLIDDGGQVRIDDFVIGQDVLILDAGVTLAQAQAALAVAQAVTVSGSPGAKVTFNAETSVTFRGLSVEQVAGIVPVIDAGEEGPEVPAWQAMNPPPMDGRPFVTTVRGEPDTNAFAAGTKIQFEVFMSEPVTVTGSPMLQVVIGTAGNFRTVGAQFNAGDSSPNVLAFDYTMQPGDVGQFSVGNLHVPAGVSIRDASGANAYTGISYIGNLQASNWMYGPAVQQGTAGNDWVAPASANLGDATGVAAALTTLNGGEGGERDALVVTLPGFTMADLDDASVTRLSGGTNGFELSVGDRTLQLSQDANGHALISEVLSTGPVLLKDLTAAGFERLVLGFADVQGTVLDGWSIDLVTATYTDLIRPVQLTQGSVFGGVIDGSVLTGSGNFQIIWSSDLADQIIVGSSNSDSIDVSGGNDEISAGGGNDFLHMWGAGASTIDGGAGADVLELPFHHVSLEGAVSTVQSADGEWDVKVGNVTVATLERTQTGFVVQTASEDAEGGVFDMVATLTNVETLRVPTFAGGFDIDLSSLPGALPWADVVANLSYSGYTSAATLDSLLFDPTVLTLSDIQLAPATGSSGQETVLTFDLIFDLTDPDVQALDPLGVIVQFGGDLDGVLDAFASSPTWSFGGQSVPMWEFNYADLAAHGRLYASPYGIAEFETAPQIYEENPLAEASGRVGQVQVLLDGEVTTPPQISVEDLIVFPIDWLSGIPPVLVVEVAEPSQVQISGLTGDNLLKYFVNYDDSDDKTYLTAMFDADPDLNQVQPSNLIELTFPGDVRSSLVPESLTFSG
jgi:hypothetical protein